MKNYVEEARALLREELGHAYKVDDSLLDLYALLVLIEGAFTLDDDVHDAWAVWRNRTQPDHPSIVLFEDLRSNVRELDKPYTAAIRRAAERYESAK